MIGNSLVEYIAIRACITGFRSITPLSFGYGLCRLTLPDCPRHLALDLWAAAEVAFYLFAYLPLKHLSQKKADHPPLAPEAERKDLFRKVHDNVPNAVEYVRKWFRNASLSEIKRDNVKDFITWAFLSLDRPHPHHEDEVNTYADIVEEMIGHPFAPGRGNATASRLTVDDVHMVHRPLAWYLIVFGVDLFTHCRMAYLGFSFYRPTTKWYPTAFPPRPLTLLSKAKSPSDKLSYWYRPHRSTDKLPVLLLHGIGIGLYTYTSFLAGLNDWNRSPSDGDVGLIAIEILPISFRITHAALSKEEMCKQIKLILDLHGFDEFVLVSHSYGSVLSTHLLKDPAIAPSIASIVQVDPVSIMLHLPDVAYNFVYREPKSANEWELWYFASMDMGVAHTLSRGFFWLENILWKEDLGGRDMTVFLAGKDIIVSTKDVAEYLTEPSSTGQSAEIVANGNGNGHSNAANSPVPTAKVNVVWCDELDHAVIFSSKVRRAALVRAVLEHCRAK